MVFPTRVPTRLARGGSVFLATTALSAAIWSIEATGNDPLAGPAAPEQVSTQQQKLAANGAETEDQFGHAVSVSGETVVVGAWLKNDVGTDSGAANVFVLNNGVWTQQKKLTADDAAEDDRFGVAVSISGATIVIGAERDGDPAGVQQGSAYVLVLETATDSDGTPDSVDDDDDNDGVDDDADPDPLNPAICGDSDGDNCPGTPAGTAVGPDGCSGPRITSWSSLRTHGHGGGEQAIVLEPSRTNGPVSEPRMGGIRKIVVTFSETVEATDGNLDTGDVVVTDSGSNIPVPTSVSLDGGASGTIMTIAFTAGLPDQLRYTFELVGAFRSTATGNPLGDDTDFQVRSLVGDSADSGAVNLMDQDGVKTRNRQNSNGTNMRYDSNTDSQINIIDLALTKSRLFRTVQ